MNGAHKSILWMISGGSSIPIAIAAAHTICGQGWHKNVQAYLVDDKLAPLADTGVNYQALVDGGFPLGNIPLKPIEYHGDVEKDAARYHRVLSQAISEADIVVGQFGIGAGYHTGGILPGSEAAREDVKLVVGYIKDDVTSITITPVFIRRMDVVFINSFGEGKRKMVAHFLGSDAIVEQEPTQVLKEAVSTVIASDVLPGLYQSA